MTNTLMSIEPTFIIFGLMVGVGFSELVVAIILFFVPCFFVFRRIFRKKFHGNASKILVWSIVSSLVVAPFLLILVLVILMGLSIYAD